MIQGINYGVKRLFVNKKVCCRLVGEQKERVSRALTVCCVVICN